MSFLSLVLCLGLLIWLIVCLLPWRPWGVAETLEADPLNRCDLAGVHVLIPARNEAGHIGDTLEALKDQGSDLSVTLVDDQSEDNTVMLAKQVGLMGLTVLHGQSPPPGWSGKIWALEQGYRQIMAHGAPGYLLLLDADIVLRPGLIGTLIKKMEAEDLQLLSLMAHLDMKAGWGRVLIPAFVFFFKLLYPFRLVSCMDSRVAAAAGGVILIKGDGLDRSTLFESIKTSLIDDCALAASLKKQGQRIWLGLTHSVVSTRRADQLSAVWGMVTRTAYTQLQCSIALLLLCSLLMSAAFIFPLFGLFGGHTLTTTSLGLASILLMTGLYLPIIHYYQLPTYIGLTLPLAGVLFLLMTWHAAWRYYFCRGAGWKGRYYS